MGVCGQLAGEGVDLLLRLAQLPAQLADLVGLLLLRGAVQRGRRRHQAHRGPVHVVVLVAHLHHARVRRHAVAADAVAGRRRRDGGHARVVEPGRALGKLARRGAGGLRGVVVGHRLQPGHALQPRQPAHAGARAQPRRAQHVLVHLLGLGGADAVAAVEAGRLQAGVRVRQAGTVLLHGGQRAQRLHAVRLRHARFVLVGPRGQGGGVGRGRGAAAVRAVPQPRPVGAVGVVRVRVVGVGQRAVAGPVGAVREGVLAVARAGA